MPWKYNQTNSSTPPTPDAYQWSGLNTYNQQTGDLSVPAGAITKLRVYAAARSSSVSTRLCLWDVAGAILHQSATFTMGVGSESVGGQSWHEEDINPEVNTTTTTYWIGLYRNPSGAHIAGTKNGVTGYRKSNTAGFPNVSSMSGATSDSEELLVGVFYITTPSAPSSINATRNSDTSITVTWSNNGTTDAPYENLYLERWDNVTNAWYAKATLGGSTTSYTDTTVIANRKYQYRIRAKNDYAYSSYNTMGAYINTTPAAPTSVVATRVSTNVNVTWSNPATNETSLTIQRRTSTDGVTWGSYATLSSSLAVNATSYSDSSPANWNQYQVRSSCTSPTLNSSYVASNQVQTLSAPNAPTGLAPNGTTFDGTALKAFSWTYNSVDGSAQTKYSIQYRVQGGSFPGTPQVNEAVGTAHGHDFAAGTFTNGTIYEYQVKTWGAYTTGSAWSATATFTASANPEATITSPGIAAYGFSELVLQWTYAQAQGVSQRDYYTWLEDADGVTLETKQANQTVLNGATGSVTYDYTLANNTTYTVWLQVKDTNLQISTFESIEFTTSFLTPEIPLITLNAILDEGAVQIEIVNPAFTPGVTVDTVYNQLYRRIGSSSDFELVLDNIAPNTTVTDYTPDLTQLLTYYVEAVSSTPSSQISAEAQTVLGLRGLYFINGGDGLSEVVKFISDVTATEKREVNENLVQYYGRTYPVRYQGYSKSQSIDFSADLLFTDYDKMIEIIESWNDIYYRDWKGRNFYCKLEGCKFDHKDQVAYQFGCAVIRCEKVES